MHQVLNCNVCQLENMFSLVTKHVFFKCYNGIYTRPSWLRPSWPEADLTHGPTWLQADLTRYLLRLGSWYNNNSAYWAHCACLKKLKHTILLCVTQIYKWNGVFFPPTFKPNFMKTGHFRFGNEKVNIWDLTIKSYKYFRLNWLF